MELLEYIAVNFNGSQTAFAEKQGVKPPQVTQWIKKKFIVVGHALYSPRRELETWLLTNPAKVSRHHDGFFIALNK